MSMTLSRILVLAACATAGDGPVAIDTADALAAGDLAPPGLQFTQTLIIVGEPMTFTVTGAAPGDHVYVMISLAGTGPGPCSAQLGLCLDILSPAYFLGADVADFARTRSAIVPLAWVARFARLAGFAGLASIARLARLACAG